MSKTTPDREGKINIVLFWFMNDWGRYGRAYEKIAEHLAKLPEVRRVVCMFPPKKVEQGHYAWPFTFTMFSKKLFLLGPQHSDSLHVDGSISFKRVDKAIQDLALDIFKTTRR